MSKSYRILFTGVLLAALLFLQSCGAEAPSYDAENTAALSSWLDGNPPSAGALVAESLEIGQSGVFLQDERLRADSIALMRALVPILYDSGVRDLGLFFIESDDQASVDSYFAGEQSSEEPVDSVLSRSPEEDLVFAADPSLGYTEYCDFLRYVKDFNSQLDTAMEPIKVIALGKKGSLDDRAVLNLLGNKTEESDTSPSMGPAFLWLDSENLGLDLKGQGDSSPFVTTHYGPVAEGLQFDGLVEYVLAGRDIRDRSFSYSTEDAPFPDLEKAGTVPADIIIVTAYPYKSVSPAADFIAPDDTPAARSFFPNIGMDNLPGMQAAAMNRSLKKEAKRYGNFLDLIRIE